MYNQEKPEVAAAQKIMLEILTEVHRICEEHKITYWLDAGTLLGAVRHGGFIPWDDDLDISMPRTDYEKFIRIAQKELPDGYFLQNRDTDIGYNLNFSKIRKIGTTLIETGENGDEPYCHGVFIDIFPYDHYRYKWFIDWTRWSYLFRDKRKKYPKGSIKRTLVTIYTNYLMILPSEISVAVRKYFEKHKGSMVGQEGNYFTYGLECCPGRDTKVEDVLPVKLGVFEDNKFFIPNNPEAVLKENFGDDYMILPPLNRRKTHSKLIKI